MTTDGIGGVALARRQVRVVMSPSVSRTIIEQIRRLAARAVTLHSSVI